MKGPKLENNKSLVTGEELARIPDLGRCELVRGQIIHAAPTFRQHGRVESNFNHELRSFAEPRKLGKVLVGEVGIYTGRDPDTIRGADVAFLSSERYARCRRKRGFLTVAPDLVVEVRSESESWADLEEKVREYLACGVRLVWVADPGTTTVRAYRSLEDFREFGASDMLPGDDVLPGFSVPVSRLFED
jgi:Uma2 family endonuclease